MCCIMSCPGKQESNESGGFFDNVLRLCQGADTWRIMDSVLLWITAAKLLPNKSVAQGKTNSVLLQMLISDLYLWKCNVGSLHMQTNAALLLLEEGTDWTGLVLLSGNKAVTRNGITGSTTDYLTSFLFIMAQGASISEIYNTTNRLQRPALQHVTDRETVQHTDI